MVVSGPNVRLALEAAGVQRIAEVSDGTVCTGVYEATPSKGEGSHIHTHTYIYDPCTMAAALPHAPPVGQRLH